MCTSLMYGAVWKNLAPAKCHYTKGQFIFVGTQTTLSVKSCEIKYARTLRSKSTCKSTVQMTATVVLYTMQSAVEARLLIHLL